VGDTMRFSSLSVGSAHTCALDIGGVAYCWGRNIYGQLGDGTTQDRAEPVRVVGDYRFVSLRASGAHTCGVLTGGGRLCWGFNMDGQLGDGTRINRTRPVAVTPW
jgi:alpha-tubulin suppressor-like RCC1 family protein